jgi:hypothetical protein
MSRLNKAGRYNYFGTITIKNHVRAHMAIADIFRDEAQPLVDTADLQLNLVYNPVTIETIIKMQVRGGNCLGLSEDDGALTIKLLPDNSSENCANML